MLLPKVAVLTVIMLNYFRAAATDFNDTLLKACLDVNRKQSLTIITIWLKSAQFYSYCLSKVRKKAFSLSKKS